MENRSIHLLVIVCILAAAAYGQGNSSSPLSFIGWRMQDAVRLVLCVLWALATAILALLVVVSGLKYSTSEDSERKGAAKKMVIQGFIAFIIVIIACPTVNYIVHGSDMKEFKCDCIRTAPPTTTTSTSTTTWTFVTVTTVTTTTTSTSTTSTLWYPKSGGGRFLLVGECVFEYGTYHIGDFYGVIFNMDGTLHKDAFQIDSGQKDPVALAVGPNRFFVAYGSNAVVLDWEGAVVKAKFPTKSGYFPVKAIQTNNVFYVLLSPESGGGCIIQSYNLEGGVIASYNVGIDKIGYAVINPWPTYFSSDTKVPEGDVALGSGNFFIVWYEGSAVYGIVYDLKGKVVKNKFTVKDGITDKCVFTSMDTKKDGTNEYINPEIEAGSKYFIVAFRDKLELYDLKSLAFASEKSTGTYKPDPDSGGTDEAFSCAHDMVYGGGKYLAAVNSEGVFFNEDGDQVGSGTFGGHGDQFTSLAYGNSMFVGIVAIHTSDDGIGASFMDSTGKHLIDTLPLVMAESPGWAAYDW